MSRLIDADVFKERLMANIGLTNCLDRSFRETPTVDAVEVVRCKDCEHMYDGLKDDGYLICHKFNYFINADDFCSYGERETDHE